MTKTLVFGCLILAMVVVLQSWSIHRLQVRVYALEDAAAVRVDKVARW